MIVGEMRAIGQSHGPQSRCHRSSAGRQNCAIEQDQSIGKSWHCECLRKNHKQLYNVLGWAWHEPLLC